jgi:hypothetical protein
MTIFEISDCAPRVCELAVKAKQPETSTAVVKGLDAIQRSKVWWDQAPGKELKNAPHFGPRTTHMFLGFPRRQNHSMHLGFHEIRWFLRAPDSWRTFAELRPSAETSAELRRATFLAIGF